ncbi:dialkylrecorsinol condensing enzyme [Uliginosibacterium sp. H1]|uniref:dialkylrecorsinol condensing enzyme n=1 Tax=Uliginosibacterium sp. H1 TaxID=3114757 RepID=UPI002E179388|nr:dialkylresorcinol condensing enzyme [Uliginosibacterium sp. H1]
MNAVIDDTPAAVARKRVLVLRYSQSGQLDAVADQLIAPLQADARFDVHIETLRLQDEFPFPWPFFRFLDAFPESAHLVPPPLAPLGLSGDEDFDLIILPWQVWFLAPSQPVTAFLKHPVAARLLRGKPVVTAIACRNMWMTAQEKMEALLAAVGARLVDNVVLTDPGPTLATFITTPRWMWTGRRDGFWGLPPAGVSPQQILGMRRFGLALRDGLLQDAERHGAPLLAGLRAVEADPRLYVSERAGTRSFYLWGKLLRAAGAPGSTQRIPLLALYAVFLIAIIITVVPISLLLQAALRPLMRRRLAALKARFESPSGSGTERMSQYEL